MHVLASLFLGHDCSRCLALHRLYAQVTELFTGYVGALLAEHAANPSQNWRAKDCAVYLVVALTVRGRTAAAGATATNQLVSVADFFTQQVGFLVSLLGPVALLLEMECTCQLVLDWKEQGCALWTWSASSQKGREHVQFACLCARGSSDHNVTYCPACAYVLYNAPDQAPACMHRSRRSSWRRPWTSARC
jgi:hypothetical protein